MLRVDKKSYKNIDIYYIGYITIKKIDDCESIYSVNPLYLQVDHASGYIKEKNGNKYLIFDDSVDENKKVLKKYSKVWDRIEDKIKAIDGGKENDNEKGYMKIKFNSDDDLPLSIAIIRFVFQEDGKIYPQFFFRQHFV